VETWNHVALLKWKKENYKENVIKHTCARQLFTIFLKHLILLGGLENSNEKSLKL